MSIRQRLSSRWVSVLLVLLVVWLARQAGGMWVRVRHLSDDAARMEDRVVELERDIERREEMIGRIQDPAWLAYQARLRLNYKLPDEQVVVVYKKENADIIGAVASTSDKVESRSWFSRLWQRIRGADRSAEAP